MSRYRSQGLLAVGIGLAAAACGEPDLQTDLRPSGPPDVLAVMTQTPLAFALFDRLPEQPFYCKYVNGKLDEKAPTFVGDPITGGTVMCPEDEADFAPATLDPLMPDDVPFGVRVVFDELLNADLVETLECDEISNICSGTLAETQPVGIKCGPDNTEVPYTGYYVPNGNRVTYPLGPSIYFQPDPAAMTFATGSTCTFTVNADRVEDKDGNPVPEADRSFQAQIADLALQFVDPPEGADAVISPDPAAAGAAAFVFNANLDEKAIDPALFQLADEQGNAIDTAIFVGAYTYPGFTDAVYVFPDTDTGIFEPGTYSATMLAGELQEINGGTTTVAEETTHFSVAFDKTGQTSGTDFPVAGAPIRIYYNNTLDPATVGADDVEFFATTSNPPNMAIPVTVTVGNAAAAYANTPNNSIIVKPNAELPLGTYALRIKAGAEVKDVDGNTKHYNTPVALTYNVLLKVARTIPANNGTLLPTADFKIVFSGSLDPATVGASEFQLIDLTTMMPVPATVSVVTSTPSGPPPAIQPHANDTVNIHPNAALVPGRMYRVTMAPGTSLTNVPPAGFSPVTRAFATATNWTFTATAP